MPPGRAPVALVYVQHLLGIGHLARMARIVAAMRDHGMAVTLVRGGFPVAGFDVQHVETIQLDPVQADAHALSRLVGADGLVFDEMRQDRRRDALLAVLERLRPDILLVEAFPFGRRAMRFELLPLLERARVLGTKVIASSIRDILQDNRKPGRAEETAATIERWFDFVLVHGDEAATPLMDSFALAERIAGQTVYTGIVAPETPVANLARHGVIVSAGGGAVGSALIRAAIGAAQPGVMGHMPWLMLTGPNMAGQERAALRDICPPNVEIRDFVTDLPGRLSGAAMSVSQAGYNTVADLLVSGCPAVLVPFEAGGETEQLVRARMMERAGRAVVLRENDLSATTISQAIANAAALPMPVPSVALNGAAATARALLAKLAHTP
jgi:predicted glycosyltransferase